MAGIFMLVKHGVGGKIGKIAISLLIIGLAWYVLGDPRKPLDALAQLVGKVFGGK
ncbi:TPA: TcpD family membrane protein [Enterococcus faecalis]